MNTLNTRDCAGARRFFMLLIDIEHVIVSVIKPCQNGKLKFFGNFFMVIKILNCLHREKACTCF